MRKFATLCLFFMAVATAHSQTNVGGVISGNVTWTSMGNPYTVTANTLVQFASTLTIMPGVQINVNQGLYFQVDGTIRVQGSASSPVIFQSSVANQYWGGIRFTDMATNYDSTSDTGNRISHAVISGMNNWTNTISIDSCWVRIHKTEIFGGQFGIDAHNASCFLDSNYIHDTYGGGIVCWDDATNVFSPHNIIRGNLIHDCQYGIGMSAMRGKMEGNTVYNVPDGAGVGCNWLMMYPPVFVNNIIMNCSGTALFMSEFCEGGIYTGNVFRNNYEHLRISCDPKCVFSCNRMMECTGPFKVYGPPTTWGGSCPAPGSGNYYIIDLDSNSWDGMTTGALDTMTYDFNDNFAVGLLMSYQPMLTDSDACLSPIPPFIPPPNPSVIHDEAVSLSFSVWPNPFAQTLTISVNETYGSSYTIELFCVDGKILQREELDNGLNQFELDLTGLVSGTYFVKVTSEGITGTQRIVKTE